MAEIEQQIHSVSNLENLRAAQQERLNSMLWEKSIPASAIPTAHFPDLDIPRPGNPRPRRQPVDAMTPFFPPAMFYCMADLSHGTRRRQQLRRPTSRRRRLSRHQSWAEGDKGVWFVNPSFAVSRAAAEAAGIGVLAYAFLDAALPAAAQAKFLLATVGNLGGSLELAIDCESNAGAADGSVTIPLAAAAAQAIADAAGFLPFFYSTRFGPDGKEADCRTRC